MADEARDEKEMFRPGYKPAPGPGRPRSDSAEKLRVSLEEVIGNGTLPKWKAAMKRRLEKGDQWATEFVFERIAGKVPSLSSIPARTAGLFKSRRLIIRKPFVYLHPKMGFSES